VNFSRDPSERPADPSPAQSLVFASLDFSG